MKIRDKTLKADVAVRDRDCLARPCYRPRRDPGILIPGIGYRERSGGNGGYECGWREVHGCPNPAPPAWTTEDTAGAKKWEPRGSLELHPQNNHVPSNKKAPRKGLIYLAYLVATARFELATSAL